MYKGKTIAAPGQIDPSSLDEETLIASCGDACMLRLTEVEYADSVMSGGEFLRRHVIGATGAIQAICLGK